MTLWGRCWIALSLLVAASLSPVSAQERATNVILVTFDGVRVEEMFGGLDATVLRSQLREGQTLEDHPLYRRYGAASAQERRAKLMPFFWNVLMREHGWIAGNAALGSRVRVGNTRRFSYPGYAELLTGRPRDATVTSNDDFQNPHPTVLEFVREALDLPRSKVAAFGSWDRFEVIPEHRPGTITINAGFMPFEDDDPGIARLNALQADARAWPEERFDAFTAAFALRYLERERPRLLYVALGDTDEWAHAGRYDFTLDGIALADRFLRELWAWLQAQPGYRDNTLLIVTTDHGRGRTAQDWTDHGADVEGAQDIWLAIAGPGQPAHGELHDAPTLRQGQVAATVAAAFGLDFSRREPQAETPVRIPAD